MNRPWWQITWGDVAYYVIFLTVWYIALGIQPTLLGLLFIPVVILGIRFLFHKARR